MHCTFKYFVHRNITASLSTCKAVSLCKAADSCSKVNDHAFVLSPYLSIDFVFSDCDVAQYRIIVLLTHIRFLNLSCLLTSPDEFKLSYFCMRTYVVGIHLESASNEYP